MNKHIQFIILILQTYCAPGEWTWLGGEAPGSVNPNPSFPKARSNVASCYCESTKRLYFFGGFGHNIPGMYDFWEVDVETLKFKDLGRSYDETGRLNDKKQFSSRNWPPGRFDGQMSCSDDGETLRLYGGVHTLMSVPRTESDLRDLWIYSVSKTQWNYYGDGNSEPDAVKNISRSSIVYHNETNSFYVLFGWERSVERKLVQD
jgi:hypothetical protein